MREVVTLRAEDAAEQLVLDHLPLARHLVAAVAGRLPRHVNLDELQSAALFGLAQAAQSFDPAMGVPFTRHATLRIRGAILDELRGMDWASRSVRRQAREIDEVSDRLAAQRRRSVTTAEIADELGLRADDVSAIRARVARAQLVHYDGISTTEGGDEILPAARCTPDEILLEQERRADLRAAIMTLPPRLRLVVEAYYFDERPMQELAEELGVSSSRVSQLRSQAISLIGKAMREIPEDEVVEGGLLSAGA